MKPAPADIQDLYLESLRRIGLTSGAARHPLRRGRLGEPDARRLGARLGGLVRRHGSVAVHLFPAGRRLRLRGRLGRDHLRPGAPRHVRAGRRPRVTICRSTAARMRASSATATSSCRPSRSTRASTSSTPTRRCCCSISRTPSSSARRCSRRAAGDERHEMALPAYDQCIKASHIFNLLDARGVISVTERQSYHPARARAGQGLLRRLAQDRWRTRLMHPDYCSAA